MFKWYNIWNTDDNDYDYDNDISDNNVGKDEDNSYCYDFSNQKKKDSKNS